MRRKIGVILGAIIIVGLCVIVFLLRSEKLSGRYTYGDYKIKIDRSVYCKNSQIGYIDMQVKATGKQTDKLFHTSDDLLNNGFDFIIDDTYILQVWDGDSQFKVRGYELNYKSKTQYLRIYFINPKVSEEIEHLKVGVVKTSKNQVEIDFDIDPVVDKEVQEFTNGNYEMHVTAAGIMVDTKGRSYFEDPDTTAVTMDIDWEDKKMGMNLKNNMEEKEVNGRSIVKYKLKWLDGGYCFYAIELEDWKDILQICVGGNIYTNSAVSKRAVENEDDPKKKAYKKLLNSMDYFETSQGAFEMKRHGQVLQVEYKVDFPKGCAWEHAVGEGVDFETITGNAETLSCDHIAKQYLETPRVEEDYAETLPVEERVQDNQATGLPVWYCRTNITGFSYADKMLFPQEGTFQYLRDFELWDITGKEKVAGRNCWKIEGELTESYSDKTNVKKYKWWVDKETGCLLKYEGYDTNGELTEYLTTKEVEFDSPVSDICQDKEIPEGYTDWLEN